MSNSLLKKVTSAVALTAIVASTIGSVSNTFASTAEQDAANALAAAGVISDNSSNVSAYRLGDTITRREMLKVMVNMATPKLTVENKCEGKFTDLPATDWGCKYAETALAAGFLAANSKFRPNDNVSKAEALKMVMKAQGIAKDASAASWEAAYVNAAVTAGLISASFSDYSTASKRGFTFSAAANAISGGDDLGLGGLLGGLTNTGTTNTGTTDTTTVVKAGSLGVSLNPTSAANGTLVPKAGTVRFAVVDFTAGSSDVLVNTVKIAKQGLNTTSGVSKVWFEKNGTRVSSQASFSSEGDAVISFAPAYIVKAGETATLDMYVELTASAGVDYQFASVEISTSAADFSGSFVTPVLRTADYTVAGATITAQNTSGNTYNASNDKVELGKFTVANTDADSETRDETFQTVMLYQSGAASLDNLSNIVVERNGVVVSSNVVVSGKTVAITLNDTIKDGVTATYLVRANIARVELTTDVYQLYLKKATDINIIENKTGFRSTVSGLPVLGLYNVKGGDVTFTTDSATAKSANVAPGTSDVVLMKGTIEAKNSVNLEDIDLTITTTTKALSDIANTIYLQIGNSTFSATPIATGSTFVSTLRFNGSVTVDGTAAVKVYTKLKDASAGSTIKVSDMTLNSFVTTKEYSVNQNTINSFVGTIAWVLVTVDTTTLNGTRVDGLGATNLAVGAKSQTIFAGKYSQSQGNAVNLSNFNATFAGSGLSQTGANVTVSLYVNGVVKSTKSVVAAQAYSFDGLNATVTTAAPVTIELKADFNDAIAAGTFNVSAVAFDTTDSLTSANVNETALVWPAFTILAAGAVLASSDNNPKATLLTSGVSDNKLFAFKLTARNDTVKLKDITISGTGLDSFSNFRLSKDGTDAGSIGVASTTSASSVVFQNVSDTTGTAMDKSNSYYVIANANTNTNTGNIAMSLSSVVIKASNGTESTVYASAVDSKVHAIAENTLVVAKIDNANKSLSTSAMRFTVTAAGKDSVTLSGFTFTQNPTGYTATGTVKVYKDSVATANLVTSSANNTVDAGSTVTFIAVVDNATKDGNANTVSYELKLDDVETSTISSINDYLNTWAFSFVETISN